MNHQDFLVNCVVSMVIRYYKQIASPGPGPGPGSVGSFRNHRTSSKADMALLRSLSVSLRNDLTQIHLISPRFGPQNQKRSYKIHLSSQHGVPKSSQKRFYRILKAILQDPKGYGTTNIGSGTTNMDAGVGIG